CASSRPFKLKTSLLNAEGRAVASLETAAEPLAGGADREVIQELRIANPQLWSPNSPYLYQVRSEMIAEGTPVQTELTHIGIRRFEITADGFRINGDKMFLRGCNRHQE